MSILSHKPRTVRTHTITMACETSVADAMIRITDFMTQICPRIFHAHHAWHAYVKRVDDRVNARVDARVNAPAHASNRDDRVFARLEPPQRCKDEDWQSFLGKETGADTLEAWVRALGHSTKQTHTLPPGAYNHEHCVESMMRSCAPIPMLLVGFPNESARYVNADLDCVSTLIDTALCAYDALCESPIGYAYWRHYHDIACLSESAAPLQISAQLYLLLKGAQRDTIASDTSDLDELLKAVRKRNMRVKVDKQRCSIAANRLVMSERSAEQAAHDVSGFGEVMRHDIYWCAEDHPYYQELADTLYLELRVQLMCRDLIECYFQFCSWDVDASARAFSWQQCCESVRHIARNGYTGSALTEVIARLKQNRSSASVEELANWIKGGAAGKKKKRKTQNRRSAKKKSNRKASKETSQRAKKTSSLETQPQLEAAQTRAQQQQLEAEIDAFRDKLAQVHNSMGKRLTLDAKCYESIVKRVEEIKNGKN